MKLKPIHKFNNGNGATLCNSCYTIITQNLTKDLYCEKCKEVDTNFVPYDVSVLLKDIGFDKPCFAFYRDGKIESVNGYTDDNLKPIRMLSLHEITGTVHEIVLAPLYQQALDWFRDRKFLVDITSHHKNAHEYYIKWNTNNSILSGEYTTFSEAQLECLIKLIEIFKLETKE